MDKMSEETYDYICNGCDSNNKTVKAVKYCLHCKVYCCQSCVDMHKIFPPLVGHSFLEVGQGNESGYQQSSVSDFPTERCSKHAGKVLDMYCQKHDEVGCCTCMAQEHRSCPDSQIVSVPDMIGTLFNLSESKKTQSRLQQMMNVMTSLNELKHSRLESLKQAKNEAMNKIEEFENALKAILHKAAEKPRMEVEEEFMKIEKSLLQEIRSIDDTNAELKETDDKLTKAAANKAQRFVCSKEAEKNIKVAENEKVTQETNDKKDPTIYFHPNQALKENIQGSHGIGDVLVAKRKRSDVYKVKSSSDINIKDSNDTKICRSYGCCLTSDNQLLVTDVNNRKIKRIDTSTLTIIESCLLDGYPGGICCFNKQEAAVACLSPNKIQFVSIENKMKTTRKIDTSHPCYGIAMKDDHIYVTHLNTSLYVYDMNGTLLKTVINDNDGNKLFSEIRRIAFNKSGDKMFVGDGRKGLVCCDGKCNHLYTIADNDLNGVVGVCTDGSGNVFVTGYWSNNVVQFNEDGKKIGVVVKQENGLNKPRSIAIHEGQNRMYVTMLDSNIMKMYELQ